MSNRYIVHGTDASGKALQKIIEAPTAAEAERVAGKLGMAVLGVEVDPASPPQAAPPPDADPRGDPMGVGGLGDDVRASRRMGPETQMWEGHPSQWVNFWWFLACILVLPIPVAIWKYLETRTSKFKLTTQRLRLERGVLTKTIDEVELYRVKDTQLNQSLSDRMLGIGTIEILSSDETNPTLYLHKIPRPAEFRELLRGAVERLRLARGVRELDLAVETDGGGHR